MVNYPKRLLCLHQSFCVKPLCSLRRPLVTLSPVKKASVVFVVDLQSWTKFLGQIYICASFSHAPNKQSCANSSALVQPLPHPLHNVGHVYTPFLQKFNIVLGGGGTMHFEMDNGAFLKQCFKNTEN